MGLDPGFRTGVKVAVVDATGKVAATPPSIRMSRSGAGTKSLAILGRLCRDHKVDLIAIGNGTASRETDKLAAELITIAPELKLTKIVVSEAGASVYSASAYASAELPDLDVSLRGAVSIARRLQDPLAELVKIDPKSIGVGQYQHDLAEGKLSRSLDAVVEDCVNAVGVDVNTASAPLLARVSGINEGLAKNIVLHRDANGPFRTRKALQDVPRLGPKAFEQCAGFLRIPNGDDPLDASSVHPEAYPVVRKIVKAAGTDIKTLIGNAPVLRGLQPKEFVDDTFGLPTVTDILRELEKPGRDPRPAFKTATFKEGVEKTERSAAGHGARRRGDQRGGVRRVRRYRRASGRSGARLGHVPHLRQRPARGGEAGRHRQGEGAGGGCAAQAHLADAAARRRDRHERGPAAGGRVEGAELQGQDQRLAEAGQGRRGWWRRRLGRCPAARRPQQWRPAECEVMPNPGDCFRRI